MKYLALLLVPLLAGPASGTERRVQNCLRQNQVNGWTVIDDQTLIVSDRTRNRFKVTLAPGCHGLKWPMRLGFTASSHLSCIGRHDFLLVPPNGGYVAQRCMVAQVVPYMGK